MTKEPKVDLRRPAVSSATAESLSDSVPVPVGGREPTICHRCSLPSSRGQFDESRA